MGELSGKLILITGAAWRIGRALAVAVARAGADVIVHYNRSQAQAESARQEIQALGQRAYMIQADLGDPQQVQAVFEQALTFGTVSGLVNSAA